MSRIPNLLLTVVATLIFSSFAIAQNTLPLNTGFDHSSGTPYSIGVQDNYWINIASFPPSAPVAPTGSWVILKHPLWAAPFANTQWISARTTFTSASGTNPSNPAYVIFRKCFCLQPGFTTPSLSLSVRGDDNIEIWLNTITNEVLDSTPGNSGSLSSPILATHTAGFVQGRNCLYVLLEDTFFGATGLNLQGTVSARGSLLIAQGVAVSFAPCNCLSGPLPTEDKEAVESRISDQDEQIIREILEIREARRRNK